MSSTTSPPRKSLFFSLLLMTFAAIGCGSDSSGPGDVLSEDEFHAELDRELPDVFNYTEGDAEQIPLAFFAKTSCGAVELAQHEELAEEHGAADDPLYQGTTAEVRERLVERWAERLGEADGSTFVNLSIESFCPEYK